MFPSRLRVTWLAFFLASALSLAPGQSGTSSSRQSHPVHGAKPTPDAGVLADNLYRNRFFGFSYKVPFGWVDRTAVTRLDSCRPEDSTGGSLPRAGRGDARTGTDCSQSLLLLSVFERPPEVTGETVNSSVLMAAESVSSYPGLKDASQYFGPLTEIATSKGFKVVNEPYDVAVGGKRLVRADFIKGIGKLTMYQSTLAMIEKGYAVSFTFLGSSEDEVEELIGNLQWSYGRPLGQLGAGSRP